MEKTVARAEWIVGWPTDDSKATLLCIPHAGGGVGSFRRLANACRRNSLPVEVCAVRFPGREDAFSSRHVTDGAEAVNGLANQVSANLPGPIILLGSCSGATVALALASRLEGQHKAAFIGALIVLSQRAPQVEATTQGATLSIEASTDLWNTIASFGGTPEEVSSSPALRKIYEKIFRSDLSLLESLPRAQRSITCSLLALCGSSDPKVAEQDLQGWRDWTTGEFQCRTVEGDHWLAQHPTWLSLLPLP